MDKSQYSYVYAKISPEPNTGCWIWTGAISDTGYGNVSVVTNGKRERPKMLTVCYTNLRKVSFVMAFKLIICAEIDGA
jgi:hypothetical protein